MDKYRPASGDRLYQCEILTGVLQPTVGPTAATASQIVLIEHPYCLVLSQDCDLEQAYKRRADGKEPGLPNVLLCMAEPLQDFRGKVGGSDIWRRVKTNSDERYHCIEDIPEGADALHEGLPGLGLDFKRYFTIPFDDLCEQLSSKTAHQRTIVVTPYAEQLSARFANYLSRIGLPNDFQIELPS